MNEIAKNRIELIEKINAQTTQQLIDMAVMMKGNTKEGANIVMAYITNALMDRIPEDEFVEFCESLTL